MEKRLRSALQTSPDSFLSLLPTLPYKTLKPSLKTLIHTQIPPSSPLSTSLPFSLHLSISHSLESFKLLSLSPTSASPSSSPPTKLLRRSSRTNISVADAKETNILSKRAALLNEIQIYNYLTLLCVLHPSESFSAADLLPSVQALHESLILFENEQILLSEIASVCEEWWKEGLEGRETLISQTLPYLVSRSLTLRKKVDVKRVYGLREAFLLFDFEDESIEDLKMLLVRCVIAPVYLKLEEGRKFIAFLFGLSGQLVKEVLAIVKAQIPFGRKSMLEAYADVVFRAWKVADGVVREEIENGFLQGLVDGAVHAGSSGLVASVRRVLGGFVNQRVTPGVEKLLFRITEPVIFRSLQVANSNVRQNALHLLLDVFPLEDPDSTKEVKDAFLERQFFLLDRLLQDQCPDVRVVAVEGSCRILHLFWEIIPSPTITKTVTKVFDDMSHDIQSEVRLSTLNGVIYLLGNPQTHESLKVLLPRLGHLVRDPIISIRVAVVNLLLAVRDIRMFEFHKFQVVRFDALLSSLANDQPPVAQKITCLLIPSYFPSKLTSEEACMRCITLIKKSPLAGARFCEFALTEGSSPKSLMELVRMVCASLVSSCNGLNSDQIDGFLITALNLCNALMSEATYRTHLKKLFSGDKLRQLFAAAGTEHAQSTVIEIASIVSPDNMPDLIEVCKSLIKNSGGLFGNVEKQAQVRSAHKLMVSSSRFDELFGILANLLQTAASGCHIKFGTKPSKNSVPTTEQKKAKVSTKASVKKKNVKGKKSTESLDADNFRQQYAVAAGAAWQIKELLASADTRDIVLKSRMLKVVFAALKGISEACIEHCMCLEYLDTAPVLAYTAIALHTWLQNGDSEKNDLSANGNGLDSDRFSVKGNVLETSMMHLFSCTKRLFTAINSESSGNLPFESEQNEEQREQGCKRRELRTDGCCPSDDGSSFPYQKQVYNMVKMVTAVLKFTVDASTICTIPHNQQRCLQFALTYVRVIILILRKHPQDLLQLKEGDLKALVFCLKSSFTYTMKLLNLVLRNISESSQPLEEASDLSNDLLNLIMLTESNLGSRHASSLVPAVKPWLSDLVLALGSCYILVEDPSERDHLTATSQVKPCFLPWLRVLGNVELCELGETDQDEESNSISASNEYPVFKKVVEKVVQVLRRNIKVLDSVGVIFLTGLSYLLQREENDLVFGLVHFVCVKLVQSQKGEWAELPIMLATLRELYPRIEKFIENPSISEDGRQMLVSAKELLEPVWINHVDEEGYMREED